MDKIVRKLEKARKSKKVSKSAVCVHIGISRSAFYKKLSGENSFTSRQLEKWAEFLGLELGLDVKL